MRILLFLYHAGYLRHYGQPVRLLAEGGHTIHLAFTTIEKDAGDRSLAERLAEDFPDRVTFGEAPTRRYFDGWRRTSTLVRAFTDLARYIDPRYAHAPALRERMGEKIKRQIFSGRADPLTSFALARIVDRLSVKTDAKEGRRLLRFLVVAERAVPTSRVVDRFIAAWQPDAVLVSPLVEYASNQVDYLKSARRLGVPTAACVASWDNLTNKGLLRFTPDRVLVWNEQQRRELTELHGIPSERAVVTGGQKFDPWFELSPTRSAADHRRLVGLRDDSPYLLYVCSSPFIAPDEVSFVREWIQALRSAPDDDVRRLAMVVRPHPQNAAQWESVDLADPRATIWPRGGAHPDVAETRTGFYDSIHHSVAVVGVNTSAMIDAAIIGRNVLTILDPRFAATQEGTLHFKYLLRENGGFLNIAPDLDEHVAQVRSLLQGGPAEAERLGEFVASFVRPRGLDVPVSPLVAEEMLAVARLGKRPRTRREPLRVYALRALLVVPTLAATATLLFGAALERVTGGRVTRKREERRARAKTASLSGPVAGRAQPSAPQRTAK